MQYMSSYIFPEYWRGETSCQVDRFNSASAECNPPEEGCVTGVAQVAEADPRDAVTVAAAVVGTRLRDVDAIQAEGRHALVGAALLDPAESGLTAEKKQQHRYAGEDETGMAY